MALTVALDPYSRPDANLYPGHSLDGPSPSAVSLSSIIAGTVAAIALTITLGLIGTGFGLASVSIWPGAGASPKSFTIGAGLWLIVTQWLSAAVGGYIAGRLRTRWHGLHTDEVFFRDTAHGFVTWALATALVAMVAVGASTLASLAPVPPADVKVTADDLEAARKAAAAFATFTGISLVVGAFIGSVGGALGGRLRDLHP
ncbi:hypothetical protein [Sphingomonas panacisoli]|uniref:hypothetical protein n=1 Tax=Sphingomonas panacisoli TaxID=1813879 RepID=UPI00195F56D9|nr:hypothetical protein [Sphingomonas panacisoli]